jgi:hypothetical protein
MLHSSVTKNFPENFLAFFLGDPPLLNNLAIIVHHARANKGEQGRKLYPGSLKFF